MTDLRIKDAVSGDPVALARLIDEYKDLAYNLALSIVKNPEDARDITHDSFLKVLAHIHRFRNESRFSTWLYKIVYNQSLAFVNQRERHWVALKKAAELQLETEPDESLGIYEELYHVINQLEDNEKYLIQLFYLGEKSVREIHEITNLSISNIKVMLHRTRKKLHEKLTQCKDKIVK